MNSHTKRVAIYVRQSEDVDHGIERQLRRCRNYVGTREWIIMNEYVDNHVSATKSRGPGTAWHRLLQDAERGRFDTVVAVNLDRLARSVKDVLILAEYGLDVATLEGDLNTTTADGSFRLQLLASLAEFEARRKGERQRRANQDKHDQGKPAPGRRRYGYEPDNMTIRETEAAVIRRIFAETLDGASLRSLSIRLNEEGHTPTTGKGLWRPLRIRETLRNPAYKGALPYRGGERPSEHIQPIVSVEDWEAVAALLNSEGRRTSPGGQRRYLLSGIATCGVCGSPLKSSKNYYLCYRVNETSHVNIVKGPLDQRVYEEIATALLVGGADAIRPNLPSNIQEIREEAEITRRNHADAFEYAAQGGLLGDQQTKDTLDSLLMKRNQAADLLSVALSDTTENQALVAFTQDLLGDDTVISMNDWKGRVQALANRIAEAPLEHRRELVKTLITVEVPRAAHIPQHERPAPENRPIIEHLRVVQLNPWHIDSETYSDD